MDGEDVMPGMTVREATHDDYEAVMKMASSETFRDGFDYLPAKFHRYVDDPDTQVFVAEVDGQLTMMMVTLVKDDEAAMIGKTVRVAPGSFGKEFGKKIIMFFTLPAASRQFTRGKNCKAVHGMLDVQQHSTQRFFSKLSFDAEDIIIDTMYFSCDVSIWSDNMETADLVALPTVAPYQAADMARLMSPHFLSTVLSQHYIFVDWDPYKLSESSMKKFVDAGCYILIDQNKPAAKSLSFGGSYMTPRGRVYHIDVHCRDEVLCKAHIINHVKNACSKHTGLIIFCIMVIDQALKETVMKYCVEDLALSHLPHDHTFVFGQIDLSNLKAMSPKRMKSKY